MLVINQPLENKKTPINNPMLNELVNYLDKLHADRDKYPNDYFYQIEWQAFNEVSIAFKAIAQALDVEPADLERSNGSFITSTEI